MQFGNADASQVQSKANHAIWATRHAGLELGKHNQSKELPLMELEEYDFTRNPIVENQTFFLESKCIHCGFVVLARTLEELVEEEKGHRAQCAPSRAASSH